MEALTDHVLALILDHVVVASPASGLALRLVCKRWGTFAARWPRLRLDKAFSRLFAEAFGRREDTRPHYAMFAAWEGHVSLLVDYLPASETVATDGTSTSGVTHARDRLIRKAFMMAAHGDRVACLKYLGPCEPAIESHAFVLAARAGADAALRYLYERLPAAWRPDALIFALDDAARFARFECLQQVWAWVAGGEMAGWCFDRMPTASLAKALERAAETNSRECLEFLHARLRERAQPAYYHESLIAALLVAAQCGACGSMRIIREWVSDGVWFDTYPTGGGTYVPGDTAMRYAANSGSVEALTMTREWTLRRGWPLEELDLIGLLAITISGLDTGPCTRALLDWGTRPQPTHYMEAVDANKVEVLRLLGAHAIPAPALAEVFARAATAGAHDCLALLREWLAAALSPDEYRFLLNRTFLAVVTTGSTRLRPDAPGEGVAVAILRQLVAWGATPFDEALEHAVVAGHAEFLPLLRELGAGRRDIRGFGRASFAAARLGHLAVLVELRRWDLWTTKDLARLAEVARGAARAEGVPNLMVGTDLILVGARNNDVPAVTLLLSWGRWGVEPERCAAYREKARRARARRFARRVAKHKKAWRGARH